MEAIDVHEVLIAAHEGEVILIYGPSEVPGSFRCDRLRVTLGPMVAEIDASTDADPVWLSDQLRALLSSPTLTGVVEFAGVESDLRLVRVELAHGKGCVTFRVEADHAADGGADLVLTTDQAALQNTVRDLDAVILRP